jgi:DNA-binding transcriptional regulator YhcF (GntR family)
MDESDGPELVLDGCEPVPRQLAGQLRRHILGGTLRPGEELPTVRAVAVGLAVSPQAVEEAYGRLEREGFVSRDDGCGPRVAAPARGAGCGELDNWCQDFLRRTAAAGFAPAEVLRALHACIDGSYRHG